MIQEFTAGVGMLLRGFGMWRTQPRLMALGLIPAVLAFLLLAAALIPFGLSLGGITSWLTPFANSWDAGWQIALRTAIGIALFVAAVILSGLVFTALALTIGDPFYQRIWRGVERSLGGEAPRGESGFWVTVGEGLRLVVLGILIALLTLVIGFVPLVGGAIASVTGVVLTGRVLARELTGRAFDARGLTSWSRSEILALGRARVLGFGIATQLCFLIPLGAIIAMPAAVAGSTMLVRSLVDRAAAGTAGGAGVPGVPGAPGEPGTSAMPASSAAVPPAPPAPPAPGAPPAPVPLEPPSDA